MYGYSDLFIWSNMVNPSLYLMTRVIPTIRIETFYRLYWLASATDAWVVPGIRDPSGDSGRFIGQEFDLRVRHQVGRHLGLTLGYAWFVPGSFVRNAADEANQSHFVYFQFLIRF